MSNERIWKIQQASSFIKTLDEDFDPVNLMVQVKRVLRNNISIDPGLGRIAIRSTEETDKIRSINYCAALLTVLCNGCFHNGEFRMPSLTLCLNTFGQIRQDMVMCKPLHVCCIEDRYDCVSCKRSKTLKRFTITFSANSNPQVEIRYEDCPIL